MSKTTGKPLLALAWTTIGCLALSLGANAAWAAEGEVFRYQGPGDLAFEVGPQGLQNIRLGTRTLAQGHWSAFDASYLRTVNVNPPPRRPNTGQTLRIVAPDHAQVRHERSDLTVTYDYWFKGEDVTISARVENQQETSELLVTGFDGLVFEFARQPQGLIHDIDRSWYQGNPQGFRGFHPSLENPIGGSYASDGDYGVGLSPWRTGWARTLFRLTPTNGARSNLMLEYYRPQPIPAGGALTFEMKLRVSANTDWKHLLDPYREHFQTTYGPLQYEAKYRPFVQAGMADDVSVNPKNPLGFHDDRRRIDRPEGMSTFCAMVLPGLTKAGGQGALLWAQGGFNPRGAMYRPDFDVLPPAVEANLPALRKKFDDAGMVLGACARPGEMVTPESWDKDIVVPISADSPEQMEALLARFDHMIKRGFTAFYLDSFGHSLNDARIMRALRKKLGPKIQTFSEFSSDVIMPYTGFYYELYQDDKDKSLKVMWINWQIWDIYRYLMPEVAATVNVRIDPEKQPEQFWAAHEFLMQRHMSPLDEDWRIGGQAERLQALTARYLDERGMWKN